MDVCVVGAGSGGASVASAAAQLGHDVVLVDFGKRSDAFRIACRALITASRAAQASRVGMPFGISAAKSEIDARRLRSYVEETVVEVTSRAGRVPFDGVKIIREPGFFEIGRASCRERV